jgi:hypothetical protein
MNSWEPQLGQNGLRHLATSARLRVADAPSHALAREASRCIGYFSCHAAFGFGMGKEPLPAGPSSPSGNAARRSRDALANRSPVGNVGEDTPGSMKSVDFAEYCNFSMRRDVDTL